MSINIIDGAVPDIEAVLGATMADFTGSMQGAVTGTVDIDGNIQRSLEPFTMSAVGSTGPDTSWDNYPFVWCTFAIGSVLNRMNNNPAMDVIAWSNMFVHQGLFFLTTGNRQSNWDAFQALRAKNPTLQFIIHQNYRWISIDAGSTIESSRWFEDLLYANPSEFDTWVLNKSGDTSDLVSSRETRNGRSFAYAWPSTGSAPGAIAARQIRDFTDNDGTLNFMTEFGLHLMQDTMPDYLGTANYRLSEHHGNIGTVEATREYDIPPWTAPPTTGSADADGYFGFSETLRVIFVKADRTAASWAFVTGYKDVGVLDRIRIDRNPSFTVTAADDFHIFSDSGSRVQDGGTEMSQQQRRLGLLALMGEYETEAATYGVTTKPVINGGAQSWENKKSGNQDAAPNEYTGAIWQQHYERIGERLGFFQAEHISYSTQFRSDIGGSEAGANYDPDTLMKAIGYVKSQLIDDSSAPLGRSFVWLNAQTRSPGSGNTVSQYSGLDELDAAYCRFWACLAWCMSGACPQLEIDEGHDLPVMIDEMVIYPGDRITAADFGTYTVGAAASEGSFAWNAADFGTHGYYFEFTNCLIVINLRDPGSLDAWVPSWQPAGQATTGDDICTLPSAGSGKKWQRFNPLTYEHPLTSGQRFAGKKPTDFDTSYILRDTTLNDGTDAGATITVGPLEAIILMRVDS